MLKENERKKLIGAQSIVYQEASAKKAEATERLHLHTFSVICAPPIFVPLKGMTEHTDAYVNISTAFLTHLPTLLSLLCVPKH